jgi:hexokinase
MTTNRQQKYTVKEELKVGPLAALIEFMAECLDSFVSFIQKENESLSLGLCISFPLVQTAINHASILQSTKDFVLTDYENKNVVELFQTAVGKRGLNVMVKAASNGAGKAGSFFFFFFFF